MKPTLVILAVLGIVGLAIGPAWNLTIAELADKYDDSATTVYQPELVIQAWADAIKDIAIGTFAWFAKQLAEKNKQPQ